MSLRLAYRSTPATSSRMAFISFANVIACLAVLYLHVNGAFWNMGVRHPMWPSSNVIECLFYFAVPVFVMISGATLTDFFDRYGMKTYFLRRLTRVVIPYLYFSILSIAINILRGKLQPSKVDFKYVLFGILEGNLGPNYYFFPLIISVYLTIPLFAAVRKDLRTKVFTYLIIVGTILDVLYPFLNTVLKWEAPTGKFIVYAVNSYLIYVPAGYLLAKRNIAWHCRRIIYVLALVGLMWHIFGTYDASMEAGKIVSTYKGYLNFPCILYSCGVFLFLRKSGEYVMKFRPVRFFILGASGTTFAIYMIHQYVLDYLVKAWTIDVTNLPFRLFFPLALFLMLSIPLYFIKKVPGMSLVLGAN